MFPGTNIATMDKYEFQIIRNAFKDGKVYRVEFYSDGSGVTIEYVHPTANHGLPCRIAQSLNIQEAIQCLAGFRLKQHEIKICY